jgi:Integrase core domain
MFPEKQTFGPNSDATKTSAFEPRQCLQRVAGERKCQFLPVLATVVEAWRRGYNETRPHGSLGWATPAEYARQCLARQALTATKEPESSTSERY